MAIATRNVRLDIRNADQSAATGTATFVREDLLRDTTDHWVSAPGMVVTATFAAAPVTAAVPVNDDPDGSPVNYRYLITVRTTQGDWEPFLAVVPLGDGSTLNFDTLVDVGEDLAEPQLYALVSQLAAEATARDAAVAANTYLLRLLASGEEVVLRGEVGGEVQMTSGTLHLTYFRPRTAGTITSLKTTSGNAAIGATLARIGIYSIDAVSGAGTLVASIPNTLALWASPFTVYTPNLSAAFTRVVGAEYAVGLLWVGSTPPQVECSSIRFGSAGDAPRMQAELSGQTDLPASFAAASLVTSHRRYQMILRP